MKSWLKGGLIGIAIFFGIVLCIWKFHITLFPIPFSTLLPFYLALIAGYFFIIGALIGWPKTRMIMIWAMVVAICFFTVAGLIHFSTFKWTCAVQEAPDNYYCYITYAYKHNDSSICEKIQNADYNSRCYTELAARFRDASFCEKVTFDDKKYNCLALAEANDTYCEKIYDNDTRDFCEKAVGTI